MTIASAIAALSPSIWYKLDGAGGATEANFGSQSNNGTVSGSVDQTAPGPEKGTLATRLYSGGQIVSRQMDLTVFVPQSLGLWVSSDASGIINTLYILLNIGDPANRALRGPFITELHSTAAATAFAVRLGSSATANIQPARDGKFWHWVVGTFTSGTNGTKLYIDGSLVSQANLTSPPAMLATDPLLVRCEEPAIVAHACWWGGVLSQTQIQTVAAELAPWPYDLPINLLPPSSGGTGGLTPDQAAQLGRIEGYTDDIPGLVDAATYIANTVNTINGKVDAANAKLDNLLANWVGYSQVTLPILTDYITQIIDSVTTTVEQAGALVQRTVGQVLSNPPWSSIGVDDLSGGVICAHFELDLSRNNIKSVFLQITDYPDDWRWRTPDHAWSLRDLAVIRFIHNGALIARYGVHTAQFTVAPLPDSYPLPGTEGLIELQPTDYHITVDFAEGVCGHLYSSIQI